MTFWGEFVACVCGPQVCVYENRVFFWSWGLQAITTIRLECSRYRCQLTPLTLKYGSSVLKWHSQFCGSIVENWNFIGMNWHVAMFLEGLSPLVNIWKKARIFAQNISISFMFRWQDSCIDFSERMYSSLKTRRMIWIILMVDALYDCISLTQKRKVRTEFERVQAFLDNLAHTGFHLQLTKEEIEEQLNVGVL